MRSTYVSGGSVMCESAEIGFMGTSAVTARREVPRVHRLLQEFVWIVLPELVDVRIGEDDGVLQHAVHTLDLPDVDVLRRIAVRVHLHRTARRVADLHR